MGRFAAQGFSTPAEIRTREDVLRHAIEFNEIARLCGLRVLPWHNLGSREPMVGAAGEIISAVAFGWQGNEPWLRSLASRRYSPLADLCRYQPEPFWCNAGGPLKSRFPSAGLEIIDTGWVWDIPGLRAFLTVPVHMPLGQVGLVAFTTSDADYCFEPVVDELALLSWNFVTSYVRVNAPPDNQRPCERLSDREIDCLAWAYYGKTDKEIAEIIGRSYATIRFYMGSAAAKLHSVNRAQTLAKAATLGYFSVKPEKFSRTRPR